MIHRQRNQNRHSINESFYCLHSETSDGLVQICNPLHYLMAEYSEFTGIVKWHRVALVTQRDTVERWLSHHYPVRTESSSIKGPSKNKRDLTAIAKAS
jgi:hypothetical protein